MKNIKIATAAVVLSALSFGVFAATPATTTVNQNRVTTVEAGSNIAPGAQSTGRSTDDAFNAHTLVAGEWY